MKIDRLLPIYSSLTPALSIKQLRLSEPALPPVGLVHPQAPTFPRLKQFINWLWSWIRPLFCCFSKKEPPKPDPIPADVLRTIQIAQAKKNAPNPVLRAIGQQINPADLITGTVLWYFGNLPTFVAQKSVRIATSTIESVASYTFPHLSSYWVKGTSLSLSTAVVWHIAEKYGYPMGKMFLIATAMQLIQLYSQSVEQNQISKARRFHAHLASQAN